MISQYKIRKMFKKKKNMNVLKTKKRSDSICTDIDVSKFQKVNT